MSWLESIIFGLVSGISEFLPISSSAHQQILLNLFGITGQDPVRNFFIHSAMLLAVMLNCRSFLDHVKREKALLQRHRGTVNQNPRALRDWRVIHSSILPLLLPMLLFRFLVKTDDNLILTVLFLTINGIILFLPERMVTGNKDARFMSAFDCVLIGSAGALSAFSGISRIACTYGVSLTRGVARKHAFTWSLVLSIYAIALLCALDIGAMFTSGLSGFWSNLHIYAFSAIASFIGSYAGIYFMRILSARPSSGGFAYYSWGAALFTFILYLTVN
jgi:undecaprenyl-diphosphatase